MNRVKISERIFYVGTNDRKKHLFENNWPLPAGVAYNSYLINDGKTALIDTLEFGSKDDYINEIKYIERPHWMEEASKAHEIRKKRNLVHAKLCIKSDEINENICKQVIEYLKDVLKTRGVN